MRLTHLGSVSRSHAHQPLLGRDREKKINDIFCTKFVQTERKFADCARFCSSSRFSSNSAERKTLIAHKFVPILLANSLKCAPLAKTQQAEEVSDWFWTSFLVYFFQVWKDKIWHNRTSTLTINISCVPQVSFNYSEEVFDAFWNTFCPQLNFKLFYLFIKKKKKKKVERRFKKAFLNWQFFFRGDGGWALKNLTHS